MRHLSEPAARVAKENFSRKYIALGRIVNCWEEIIGADMAALAQPVQIMHHKTPKKKNEKPACTLSIACSSAHATTLHYQKNLILERMSKIFGERWITDIRFVPIKKGHAVKKRRILKRKRPLGDDDRAFVAETLGQITDDDIKQRLESLGANILKESDPI